MQSRSGNVDQFHDLMARYFVLRPARTRCGRRGLVGFFPDYGRSVLILARFVVLWKTSDIPPFQREQTFRALQSRNAGPREDCFGCPDTTFQFLGRGTFMGEFRRGGRRRKIAGRTLKFGHLPNGADVTLVMLPDGILAGTYTLAGQTYTVVFIRQ